MNRKQFLINEIANLILLRLSEGQAEIDDILDKINASGIESLRPQERQYLDTYSQTGRFDDDLLFTPAKSSRGLLLLGGNNTFNPPLENLMVDDDDIRKAIHYVNANIKNLKHLDEQVIRSTVQAFKRFLSNAEYDIMDISQAYALAGAHYLASHFNVDLLSGQPAVLHPGVDKTLLEWWSEPKWRGDLALEILEKCERKYLQLWKDFYNMYQNQSFPSASDRFLYEDEPIRKFQKALEAFLREQADLLIKDYQEVLELMENTLDNAF